MQLSTLLLFFALIGIAVSDELEEVMSKYTAWGKQNGVLISDKIEIQAKSVNEKSFKVLKDIASNETIFSIPIDLVLTVSKCLSYHDNRIESLNNYTFNESSFSYDDPFFNHHAREVIFLSLVRYYSDKEPNRLSAFFSPYFNTYEDDLSNFPLYYTKEELAPFNLLDFGIKIIIRKAFIDEEQLLINMMYEKDLNKTEYIRYRHLTKAKSLLISNETALVPFFELFDLDVEGRGNVQWKVNEEKKMIEVYAVSEIKRGDKLRMEVKEIGNDELLMDYGRTIEDNSFMKEYMIDLIHHQWKEAEDIDWVPGENEKFRFDLNNLSFAEDTMTMYKSIAKERKLPENDDSAYALMIKNLEYYLKEYESANDEALNANMPNKVNRMNVRRILSAEKELIQSRIDWLKLLKSFSRKTDL